MRNKEELWSWIQEDLIPNVYQGKWYNGEEPEFSGFFSNKLSLLLGMPRVRQLRVKEGNSVFQSFHFICLVN